MFLSYACARIILLCVCVCMRASHSLPFINFVHPSLDHLPSGCTDCHKFVGAGQQAAVSSVWGGNCANQTNLYIASGTGDTEHYYPEFMYAGFRYAQVLGHGSRLRCIFVISIVVS